MRVERSTVDQVKERLAALKRKVEQKDEKEYGKHWLCFIASYFPELKINHQINSPIHFFLLSTTDLDARIEAAKLEEEEEKRRRKERKKQKREEERNGKEGDAPVAEEDDEMAKMMGFGGFGTTSKV